MSSLDPAAQIPLAPLPAEGLHGHSPPPWLKDLPAQLPQVLLQPLSNGEQPPLDAQRLAAASVEMRLRSAFTPHAPLSSRLPFSYQRIPQGVRSLVARLQGMRLRRNRRWACYPGWPLDLSADVLADMAQMDNPFLEGPTPVLLSHDLDSPAGVTHFLSLFAPREARVGASSSNYVVTHGWPHNVAQLQEIVQRGHELGAHGYDHSNQTALATTEVRRWRLNRAADKLAPYITGQQILGYRAPSLLRTRALLGDIVPIFHYDSSIPTSGGPFPVANNGCATARPFLIDKTPELPLSLPRDGSLRFLGYRPEEIATVWIQCAERIADSRGVVVLLTHCEARFSGNPPMLAAYERFLQHVADSPRLVFSTPQAVLQQAGLWQPSKDGP